MLIGRHSYKVTTVAFVTATLYKIFIHKMFRHENKIKKLWVEVDNAPAKQNLCSIFQRFYLVRYNI